MKHLEREPELQAKECLYTLERQGLLLYRDPAHYEAVKHAVEQIVKDQLQALNEDWLDLISTAKAKNIGPCSAWEWMEEELARMFPEHYS